MIERNGNGHANHSTVELDNRPALLPMGSERLLPQNLEAERSTLGSILLDETRLVEVMKILVVEDFWRDTHQIAYRALLDLYEVGVAIDARTFKAELEKQGRFEFVGGYDFITELVESVPTAVNAKYYANIVKEKSTHRKLIVMAEEILDESYSNQFSAEEMANRVEKKAKAIEQVFDVFAKDEEISIYPLPDKMDDAAFYGPLGEAVRIIEPETEACREGILMNLLGLIGIAIGPAPHYLVFSETHRCNHYFCTIAPTGQRKGAAFSAAYWVTQQSKEIANRIFIARGLSSGEGLITTLEKLRHPIICVESEFGGTLDNAGRSHCNLGAVLKQAWEGPHLGIMTKNNPVEFHHAYVGALMSVTYREFAKKLDPTDIEGGLVNRMAIAHVYRARELAKPGNQNRARKKLASVLNEIEKGVEWGYDKDFVDTPMLMSPEAEQVWDNKSNGLYHTLSAPRSGLYGGATQRRAQIVIRIALTFAVMDRVRYIGLEHINAALAVWDYCDRTARHIWGSPEHEGNMGKLIDFIETRENGVSRTDISRKAFGGRMKPKLLDQLIAQAQASGEIVYKPVKTKGATRHEWVHKKWIGFVKRVK